MFFKIRCYIINTNNNTLLIEITENEELERFHKNLIKLYKNSDNFDYTKTQYNIKINSNTKFNINYSYNNILELKGVLVTISGYSKYYSFSYDGEIFDENTNLLKTIKKNKNGYSFIANKISN